MPPREIAFLSAVVPGTGPLAVQRLRTGLVNETYRVTRDGLAYAVRLAGAVAVAPGLDRSFEARVLDIAATANLAPRPLYIDLQRGVLVSPWLEGHNFSAAEARRSDCMMRVAALTRAVHALRIPEAPRSRTPQDWIECYRASLSRDEKAAELHAAAVDWLCALLAMPTPGQVLCHSDLHTLNVLAQHRELRLLDWEYAHVSEPLWDVAGWCANNDYTGALRAEFLRHYLDRPPSAQERARLGALTWLYDYTCLLWCRVWTQRLQNAPAAEVIARAELLHARLHGTLPVHSNGEFDGANDGD